MNYGKWMYSMVGATMTVEQRRVLCALEEGGLRIVEVFNSGIAGRYIISGDNGPDVRNAWHGVLDANANVLLSERRSDG